jgi:hypothetical protein
LAVPGASNSGTSAAWRNCAIRPIHSLQTLADLSMLNKVSLANGSGSPSENRSSASCERDTW